MLIITVILEPLITMTTKKRKSTYNHCYDWIDPSHHKVVNKDRQTHIWNDYCLCIFDSCRDYARLLPQQLQDNLEGVILILGPFTERRK
jgi:hypothetical protein